MMLLFSSFPKGTFFPILINFSRCYCSTTNLSKKAYVQYIALCLRDGLRTLTGVRPSIVPYPDPIRQKNVVTIKFEDVPCNTGDPNWLEKTNTVNEYPKGLMFAVMGCSGRSTSSEILWDARRVYTTEKNKQKVSSLARKGLRGKQKLLWKLILNYDLRA